MPRVLIAEDDPVIANAMATHLRRAGMDVEVVNDGDRALKKLRYDRPDIAVVDLMLPGIDGWRITEALRAEGINPADHQRQRPRLRARQGARPGESAVDDYLAKPFGMRELVARVQASLRRSGVSPDSARPARIEAPGLVIDPDLHQAILDGTGRRR